MTGAVKRLQAMWVSLTGPASASGIERAARPSDIPLRAWPSLLSRAIAGSLADDYGIVASSIAFASFLALLPLLGFVVLFYGLMTDPDTVTRNVHALVSVIPGEAQRFLEKWLVDMTKDRQASAIGLASSGLVTLFSAARAGRSILRGIRIASGVEQDRRYFARLAMALAVVLLGGALLLGALIAMSALAFIQQLVPAGLPIVTKTLHWGFWFSATLGPILALFLVYRYVPAREPRRWQWVMPGALVGTLLWLGGTIGFGFYLGSFGSYDRTYGPVGAVVVLQLWLMLSAYILLLGAKLNAEAMSAADVPQQ